jgi:hypothetical protein
MDRPRLIRGLRIAWSVAWGILCVLLIVFWVRSYGWFDSISVSFNGRHTYWLGSIAGEIRHTKMATSRPHGLQWRTSDDPVSETLRREVLPNWSVLGFRSFNSPNGRGTSLTIPHWFPVVILAALAAAPWLRWTFSLRTLLIATTLIAVVLGLVVWSNS